MKTKWIFIVFLLNQGCASSKNYKDLVSSWEGVGLELLLASWGRPQKIYHKTSGYTVVEYYSNSELEVSSFPQAITTINTPQQKASKTHSAKIKSGHSISYTPKNQSTQLLNKTCKTIFTADTNNIIVKWKFEGDKCKVN